MHGQQNIKNDVTLSVALVVATFKRKYFLVFFAFKTIVLSYKTYTELQLCCYNYEQ
jgi:hypothetical protein